MFKKATILFLVCSLAVFSNPAFVFADEKVASEAENEVLANNQDNEIKPIPKNSDDSENIKTVKEEEQNYLDDPHTEINQEDKEAINYKKSEAPKNRLSKSMRSASFNTGETIPFSIKETGFCENCEVKQSNGSLDYVYNIKAPPGRNNLQPDIMLRYSQFYRDTSSLLGYAWQLDFAPYIERSGRLGSDKMYFINEFNFYKNGRAAKILPVSLTDGVHGIYGKEIEENFSKFEFLNDNSWLITDKFGIKYYFGSSDQSRHNDPNNQNRIHKWYLEKQEDLNGNSVKYFYYKDSGQIYPKEIKYTNYEAQDGIYSIRFEPFYSGNFTERPDRSISYKSGFQVDTKYRLDKISIAINGEVVKEYNLEFLNRPYTKNYNLKSIEEVARKDSVSKSFPKLEFGYDLSETGLTSWEYENTKNWSEPRCTVDNFPFIFSEDINNDGWEDRICINNFGSKQVFINNGVNGWDLSNEDWQVPEMGGKRWYYNNNPKYTFVDINGDRLNDIVEYFFAPYEYQRYTKVFLHNGVNGWEESSDDFSNPLTVFNEGVSFDINNDGFQDRILNMNWNEWSIFLYNGRNGWDIFKANDGSNVWRNFPGYNSFELSFPDINNDGMADAMYKSISPVLIDGDWKYQKVVYLYNNQNGFEEVYNRATHKNTIENYEWHIPEYGENGSCVSSGSFDSNSDDLGDIVYYNWDGCPSVHYNFISNGINGWEDGPGMIPLGPRNSSMKTSDFNHDGWIDYYNGENEDLDVYLNSANNSFFLNSIKNNQGGEIKIEYKNAKSFRENGEMANKHMLKWDKFLVKKISYYDRGEEVMSNDYFYEGGAYLRENPEDNYTMEFAGFHSIKTIDKIGNYSIDYFHQGGEIDGSAKGEYEDHFSKKGKAYRREIYDSDGNLYLTNVNRWNSNELGNGRYFVSLAHSIEMSYDGQTSHKDKAISYEYDEYGNIVKQENWGEVSAQNNGSFSDISGDYVANNISYAVNINKHILALPSQEIKRDQAGNKISESKYYYDNLELGQVEKGNLTKQENWIKDNDYISIQKEYNQYGLITKQIDARGNETNYVYDQYDLYPVKTINALNQETDYEYDYRFGAVSKITDPNGIIKKSIYDGFARVIKEEVSSLDNKNDLFTKAIYEYYDNVIPRQIKEIYYLETGNNYFKYTYLDGFGRIIQEKQEAEDGKFATKDYVYNEAGLLQKESLLYFAASSDYTPKTNNQNLYSSYIYDPLQRIKTITNSLGETINNYSNWATETIDPLSNKKVYYNDAYGNLIQVDEYNLDEIYSTKYEYDKLNNLIKITDALGNERNFVYDALGRLIWQDDLHTQEDSSYGEFNYQYDENGNLTQKQDAKNQIINYTYDKLNRIKSEDFQGEEGIEISYIYDNCINGIGRLCEVTRSYADEGGPTRVSYEYNNLGLVSKEIKLINQLEYVSSYQYDYQDNTVSLRYPDNTEVKNEYNQAGQLEKIYKKEPADSGFIAVIEDIDYNPLGQIVYQKQANGTETNYIYDENKLYRLVRKLTFKGTGGKIYYSIETKTETKKFYAGEGDGEIYSENTSLGGAISAYSGSAFNEGTSINVAVSKYSLYNYRVNRGFIPFDLSAIPYNAEIVSANLNLNISNTIFRIPSYENKENDYIRIIEANQGNVSSLSNDDYNNFSNFDNPIALTSDIKISEVNKGSYNSFDFNEQGIDLLEEFAGDWLKLGLRHGRDIKTDDVWLANVGDTWNSGVYFSSSEKEGTDKDPYLEITYSYPHIVVNNGDANIEKVLQDLSYEFDAVGNIIKIIDNSGTNTKKISEFAYDDLYRLISATTTEAVSGENYVRNYSYNAIGNILNKSDQGNYQYNGGIEENNFANPHAVTKLENTNYIYDKNGNLTSNGEWTHSWDYDNRLASSTDGNVNVQYKYDQGGNRVVKITNDKVDIYVNQYYDILDSGETKKYIYANGEKVATIIDRSKVPKPTHCLPPEEGDWVVSESCTLEHSAKALANVLILPDAVLTIPTDVILEIDLRNFNITVQQEGGLLIKQGGTLRQGTDIVFEIPEQEDEALVYTIYHHSDHLSGSNIETNESGEVMELMDYYPFGEVRIDEQNNDYENNYKYTGKELDKDTGLYYYGARYYDAGIGRFVSVDPVVRNVSIKQLINPQELNSYSYTLNNPLKYVDPDGRNPALFLAAGIWVIYGALTRPQPVGDNAGRVDSNIEQTVKIGGDIAVGETIGKAVGYIGGKIFGKVSKFFKTGKETGKTLVKGADEAVNSFKMSRREWTSGKPGSSFDNLLEHYIKHGDEVGAKSVEDYYNKANDFIDTKAHTHSWNEGRDTVFYSVDTKTIGITNGENKIKSFYRITDQGKQNYINSKIKSLNKE